jgi:hypothetical protein
MYPGGYHGGNGNRGNGRERKGTTPLYQSPGSNDWTTPLDYSEIVHRYQQQIQYQHRALRTNETYVAEDDPEYQQEAESFNAGCDDRFVDEETVNAIEDAAFYRDFHELDNYTAAASGTSHVCVLPGQLRSAYYPPFPEFSREVKWPIGCPLSEQLAALVDYPHPVPTYTGQMAASMLSNFWHVGGPSLAELYEYFRVPQPPPPQQPAQRALSTVHEEAEEVEQPHQRRVSIPRSSSLQNLTSDWPVGPVVERRVSRSEGRSSDVD